jgi:hypothetical protein
MLVSVYNDVQAIKQLMEGFATAMVDQVAALTELQTRVNDFRSDLFARLDQLETAQGQFTPAAQEIFDDIKANVAAVDTRVGDADGSDNTPPTP